MLFAGHFRAPEEPCRRGHGRGAGRARALREIAACTCWVGCDPGETASDTHDERAWVPGEQAGEIEFRLASPAQACPGFAKRRQRDQISPAQLDRTDEVALGALEVVELDLDHGPVDERLGKKRVKADARSYACLASSVRPARASASPRLKCTQAKSGPRTAAGGKVAGRLDESPLSEMAVTQDEPGPKRRDIDAKGALERLLGTEAVARGEEAGGDKRQVVAGRWCDPRRAQAVSPGLVEIPKCCMIARSFGEQSGWDCRIEMLDAVEPAIARLMARRRSASEPLSFASNTRARASSMMSSTTCSRSRWRSSGANQRAQSLQRRGIRFCAQLGKRVRGFCNTRFQVFV